jgi:hypothetical protein
MQGDVGELSAMEWLASQAARIYVPVGHSPDVDLIALIGERAVRVEVKTSDHRVSGTWKVLISTRGGNRSWNGLVKYFDPSRCDFLFVHVGDGRRWFIPTADLECRSQLTLGGRKYSEFEIDPGRPLRTEPAEPSLESEPARGSAGAGEPGWTVNSVPQAEWVRIPPPPLDDGHGRGERPLGRAGQAIVRGKRQMTVPFRPFAEAGLEVGDRIRFRADGPGCVIMQRIDAD